MTDSVLSGLDDTIHAKARLGIMAILMAQDSADFTELKRSLNLTEGNLGAHLRILEEAGYITVSKDFVNRRPRTTCRASEKGRAAFLAYVNELKRIITLGGKS